eukprot:19621-Heterococcus_DN1.PRE.2
MRFSRVACSAAALQQQQLPSIRYACSSPDAAVPPYTCTYNSCLSALHCVDMNFDLHVADGTDLEFCRHLVGKLMNSAL